MNIVRYIPAKAQEWDDFVRTSRNGTFLMLRPYMDYHSDRFTDCSVMFYDDKNRLRAVMPANMKDGVFYTHQGLTYGGLITSAAVGAEEVVVMFTCLNTYLANIDISKVIYKTIPHIYHSTAAEEDLYALFKVCRARLEARGVSSVIDLHAPQPWSTNRRRNQKKALQNGVVARESNDWQEFWKILEENLMSCHGLKPVHTLEEINLLKERFPENMRLFAAYDSNGTMLAGTVLYITSQVVHSQYISASVEGKDKHALDALFHHLLEEKTWEEGCRYFDFGISTEDGGHMLNETLIHQKEGFGGRAVCYDAYEWDVEAPEDDEVAVVTPAFNAAPFITQAYESLARQTHAQWQWWVVDDGSTDGTREILDQLSAKDTRVHVTHQPNCGNAKQPRDRAVFESRGRYLLMLDADDEVDERYIEHMLQRMKQTGADIVYPRMLMERDDKMAETLPDSTVDTDVIVMGRDAVRMTLPTWHIGCNGGLYRREAWINLSYPTATGDIYMNSDEVDERLYLINAEKVAFCTDAVYHYRLHTSSTTSSLSAKRFDIIMSNTELCNIMEREFGRSSLEYHLAGQKAISDWQACFALFASHGNLFLDERERLMNQFRQCYLSLPKSALSGWRNNIKLFGLQSFCLTRLLFSIIYRNQRRRKCQQ